MSGRVLFYAQHLLGIGHLVRSQRIAAELVRAGWSVDLVLGGMPVAGLGAAGARLTWLPPLKAGPGGFSSLVTAAGIAADTAYLDARRAVLLAVFERAQPDVLIVEAFPFGRRQMRFELIPLLKAARQRRPKPLVAASVRDILQRETRPERTAETLASIERDFDAVLVHGDPAFAAIEETFPAASAFAGKVHYTGIVGPALTDFDAGAVARADIVVAAGGGAVGARLLETALAAKPATQGADMRWLAVAGPQMPAGQRDGITALGHDAGVEVVPFLADLPAVFSRARLAVCQAGYNTVADLLAGRCRSVLVPFAAGGETEQTERARRLERRGLAVSLAEDGLSAASLAAAIDRALLLPAPAPDFPLDGAAGTARILARLMRDAAPAT